MRFVAIVLTLMVCVRAEAADINVQVGNFSFSPATVFAQPGDTVIWTWTGGLHSVTSDTGLFDTALLNTTAPAPTFSYTFNDTGAYRYYCSLHGAPGGIGMSGMVVVSYTTATSLATSKPATVFGESATLTATVTPQQLSGLTPTGFVTFTNGGVVLCDQIPLDNTATATCSTAPLLVGSHSMAAQYGGDNNFTNSTSPPVQQTVNKANTTTAVTTSVDPAIACSDVTWTAAISVVPPGSASVIAGTITFFDGATAICSSVTVNAASAQCSTSALASGTHNVTAQYSGSTQLNGSTSATLNQHVQGAVVSTPAGFTATAQSGTTIKLQWLNTTGATGYEIGRRAVVTDADTILSVPVGCGPAVTVAFDSAPNLDTAYIYRIRAIGGNVSDWSVPDLATTFYFANRPSSNAAIAAQDMGDLRHAANKVATAAGLGPYGFANDPLTQAVSPILALDLIAIRQILTSAFGAIGIPGPAYADGDLAAVLVKAVHFTELQDLMR